MRWYINEASLQNQYYADAEFIDLLNRIMELRARLPRVRESLYTTRSFGLAKVANERSVSEVVMRSARGDLRRQVLSWVTSRGPFIEDDRIAERDDYFECLSVDVTDGGAGEAARRHKTGTNVGIFSFVGGPIDFCINPLSVNHGLPDDRLGRFDLANVWTIQSLSDEVKKSEPIVDSWQSLVEVARERHQNLLLPDAVYCNTSLAAEPFESCIAERALQLLGHLDEYMSSRGDGGAPSVRSNELMRTLFTNASGSEPPFTGESISNQRDFFDELSFPDPENPGATIFAHWHGKVRHRFFRIHFEWPLPVGAKKLKVLYLGPKLTKG